MTEKSALEVMEELEAASGRLKKEAILLREKNNEVLKRIFFVANNPYIVWYVNKFTKQKPLDEERPARQLDSNTIGFSQFLFSLSRRELTGNAAREALEGFLASSTSLEQKWMERMVLKNLRVGVQDSTLSKVWPDLIPGFSVQLAHVLDVETDGEKVTKILTPVRYPVCVEPKLDGFRLVAIKESGKVELRSRNGNELETLPELKKVLERADYDDHVLDGEIFGTDWSVSASVILSEKNCKNETLLNYHIFDAVPAADWKRRSCDLTLVQRSENLSKIFKRIDHERVQLVMGCHVGDEEELLEVYQQQLAYGWEGAMVKDIDGTYDFKRSNSVLKLKPTSTHEGVVVGWYEGKPNTRLEGLFGGFEVMLTNGVVTRVGTGFKDSIRDKVFEDGPDTYKGSIVEVAGQLLTDDGKIRFPRFTRWRDERDVDSSVVELSRKITGKE